MFPGMGYLSQPATRARRELRLARALVQDAALPMPASSRSELRCDSLDVLAVRLTLSISMGDADVACSALHRVAHVIMHSELEQAEQLHIDPEARPGAFHSSMGRPRGHASITRELKSSDLVVILARTVRAFPHHRDVALHAARAFEYVMERDATACMTLHREADGAALLRDMQQAHATDDEVLRAIATVEWYSGLERWSSLCAPCVWVGTGVGCGGLYLRTLAWWRKHPQQADSATAPCSSKGLQRGDTEAAVPPAAVTSLGSSSSVDVTPDATGCIAGPPAPPAYVGRPRSLQRRVMLFDSKAGPPRVLNVATTTSRLLKS